MAAKVKSVEMPSDYVRRGWCQGTAAKMVTGKPQVYWATNAAQWSIGGAIAAAKLAKALTTAQAKRLGDVLNELLVVQKRIPYVRKDVSYECWQDGLTRTQAEVLQVLETAEGIVFRGQPMPKARARRVGGAK